MLVEVNEGVDEVTPCHISHNAPQLECIITIQSNDQSLPMDITEESHDQLKDDFPKEHILSAKSFSKLLVRR